MWIVVQGAELVEVREACLGTSPSMKGVGISTLQLESVSDQERWDLFPIDLKGFVLSSTGRWGILYRKQEDALKALDLLSDATTQISKLSFIKAQHYRASGASSFRKLARR